MLHDIGEFTYYPEYSLKTSASLIDYVLIYKGNTILTYDNRLPKVKDFGNDFINEPLQYLFSISENHFFYLNKEFEETEHFKYTIVQSLRQFQPKWQAFGAVTGYHLHNFYNKNIYCGHCSAKLLHKADERAMVCPECGNIIFPNMAVAIIVAITNGDKILVSKYSSGYKHYALIAGFVEVGESLEQALAREVKEEVGLKVKNIRYFSNQPWGFSQNMLVGFFADLDGDDTITLDENELALAKWVTRDELEIADTNVSLTSYLMQAFKNNNYPK